MASPLHLAVFRKWKSHSISMPMVYLTSPPKIRAPAKNKRLPFKGRAGSVKKILHVCRKKQKYTQKKIDKRKKRLNKRTWLSLSFTRLNMLSKKQVTKSQLKKRNPSKQKLPNSKKY